GTTVAIVLHDLNLTARYADHLVALKNGRIVGRGRPADVVTEAMVMDVFGMPSRVIPDPVAGTPLVLPIGRHRVLRAPAAAREAGVAGPGRAVAAEAATHSAVAATQGAAATHDAAGSFPAGSPADGAVGQPAG